jgi:hypothetical protein
MRDHRRDFLARRDIDPDRKPAPRARLGVFNPRIADFRDRQACAARRVDALAEVHRDFRLARLGVTLAVERLLPFPTVTIEVSQNPRAMRAALPVSRPRV